MKTSFIHAAKTALFLLLVTGLFTACDNSTGSEEEEQEPVGYRVKLNNQTVIEETASSPRTGTLSVTQGTTTTFTVVFIDEEGAEFTPEPEEHSITLTSQSGIVTFTNINSDTAPFSFDVVAQDTGTGTFELNMLHEGAAEFTRLGIPVEVTASSN